MIQEKEVGSRVTPCETVTLDGFVFDSGEVIDDLDGRGFRSSMTSMAGVSGAWWSQKLVGGG